MTTKHTPGPLTVGFSNRFPFDIKTKNEEGEIVFSTPFPCHCSTDKTADETLNCTNFRYSIRSEAAALNHKALADEVLRASAPELLEELENCVDLLKVSFPNAPVDSCIGVGIRKAEAAITKATKEIL